MAITWDLQMIESWFWCQTSCFGMNFLKKISKIFFGPSKNNFLAQGGPFWVPVTPQYNEIGNFDQKLSILDQFYIRNRKKKDGYRPLSSLEKISKNHIYGHFSAILTILTLWIVANILMAIVWDLQMIERLFWYQTSQFGMNCMKKNLLCVVYITIVL